MKNYLMQAMLFRCIDGPHEAQRRVYYYMVHSALTYSFIFLLSFELPLLTEARYVCLVMAIFSSAVIFVGASKYPKLLFGSGIGDAAYFYAIADFLASHMLADRVDVMPVAVMCAVLAMAALWRLLVAANLYVQVRGGSGIDL